MEEIIKRFKLFISIVLVLGATMTYLGIYIPMRMELESAITENFILTARAKESVVDQYISRCIENTVSLSTRSNIRDKIIEFKSGGTTLGELRAYTAPFYLDGVRNLPNIKKVFRVVDHQIISSYGESRFNQVFKVEDVEKITVELTQIEKEPMLVIYSPIFDGQEVIGYDLAFFEIELILEEVSQGGTLFTIIKQKEVKELFSVEEVEYTLAQQCLIVSNKKHTGYIMPIRETTKYFYIYMENKILFKPIDHVTTIVLIGFICGIAALLFLTNWLVIKNAKKILARTEKSREKYRQYANQDFLTGVSSRLYFDKWIQKRKNKIEPLYLPLAIIMVDLNHFKYINDTFGHQSGDHALQYIAGVLCSFLEKEDLVVRYGGDEFLMILNHCDYETATQVIEKIDHQINTAQKFRFPLSISYGVEEVYDLERIEQAIDRADEKMYSYKKEKRKQNEKGNATKQED